MRLIIKGDLYCFIQGNKPSQHFTYVVKKSFKICSITMDGPTNLSCYLKASNADDEEIFLCGEEEILMNDIEEMDDVMLDNILVGYAVGVAYNRGMLILFSESPLMWLKIT